MFVILSCHKPSLRSCEVHLGQIGSAVLTCIGYKRTQTDGQADKQRIYKYLNNLLVKKTNLLYATKLQKYPIINLDVKTTVCTCAKFKVTLELNKQI